MKPTRVQKERVFRAAMALCKAGRGFCFKDDLTISNVNIGKRLEYACAAALAAGKEKE